MMPATGSARPLLLYVDDSEYDRALMQVCLKRSGLALDLHCCETASEAQAYLLERAAVRPVALLLVDYRLSNNLGRELIAWVRQQPQLKDLPIIGFSDGAEEDWAEACYAAGADHCLTKPADMQRWTDFLGCLHRSLCSTPPSYREVTCFREYRPPAPVIERRGP